MQIYLLVMTVFLSSCAAIEAGRKTAKAYGEVLKTSGKAEALDLAQKYQDELLEKISKIHEMRHQVERTVERLNECLKSKKKCKSLRSLVRKSKKSLKKLEKKLGVGSAGGGN